MLTRGSLRPGTAANLLALAAFPVAAREKSHLVVMDDGSIIYGEIMSLARWKLDYRTDSAGRPSIESTARSTRDRRTTRAPCCSTMGRRHLSPRSSTGACRCATREPGATRR